MQTIINLTGLGMIFAFLFVLFAVAISKIGSEPWEEDK